MAKATHFSFPITPSTREPLCLSVFMTRHRVSDTPLAPLDLSPAEQETLASEAAWVIGDAIRSNEAFLANGENFTRGAWKNVRTKEGIEVYKQRLDRSSSSMVRRRNSIRPPMLFSQEATTPELETVESDSRASLPSTTTALTDPRSYVMQSKQSHVPLVMAYGTVDGKLEDAMFGSFADTDAAWRWRSSYVNDKFEDARMLTQIHGPTAEDPFRSLGVKWFMKEHPAALQTFIKKRDFLILEATGMTTDSKGELVGYFMMHSVDLPGTEEIAKRGVIRAKLSFCFLVRQLPEARISIYVRGFSDPGGEMAESVSSRIVADSLIAVTNIVDCAHVKKLMWLVQNREFCDRAARRSAETVDPARCGSCMSFRSRLGMLIGARAVCEICRLTMCLKCSVVKKITIQKDAHSAMEQVSARFCLGCILDAKELPSWHIARSMLEKDPVAPRQEVWQVRLSDSTSESLANSEETRPPRRGFLRKLSSKHQQSSPHRTAGNTPGQRETYVLPTSDLIDEIGYP